MRDESIFEIEAYQTTTGHTLMGVKLNYVTHGTLNGFPAQPSRR